MSPRTLTAASKKGELPRHRGSPAPRHRLARLTKTRQPITQVAADLGYADLGLLPRLHRLRTCRRAASTATRPGQPRRRDKCVTVRRHRLLPTSDRHPRPQAIAAAPACCATTSSASSSRSRAPLRQPARGCSATPRTTSAAPALEQFVAPPRPGAGARQRGQAHPRRSQHGPLHLPRQAPRRPHPGMEVFGSRTSSKAARRSSA